MARAAALDEGDWKDLACSWLEARAVRPGWFTADDLREAVPDCPSSKLAGSVFGGAAKRKLIVEVGSTRSRVPSRKGSRLTIWKGVQHDSLCV